ncbi:His Kinase A (phospho-acceptor) domain-containing protein [Lachnospiraceae bacterium NE2001]|nr:His Kinase A (phospho-acceptor) domain-containing protein [Lachnospiraceae bacterium NE2001]
MKELSRKVFLTILGMLTFILVISLVILNIVSYRREYESVKRNLDLMDNRGGGFEGDKPPGFDPGGFFSGNEPENQPNDIPDDLPEMNFDDFANMMIMDYEVYTVEVTESGTVSRVFSLGNNDSGFDAAAAAQEILLGYDKDTVKIENLFIGKYSFNYKRNNSIVIVNDASVAKKLRKLLLETIGLFLVIELIIIFISRLVTGWITRPAREAFERQKEFIADASHELKTPLAVIMASSDELVADETNARYVENIKYESDRMNKLISGLLDLSKLEEGVSKDTYKDHNLSKIVEKTALVFEGVAFEQGVLIETDIEEDITLKCSKDEMEKLVSTLLDNAVKHSNKDTTVRISLYRSNATTKLKITNTGEPIAEGDEEKIFERFYRADKSRSRSENRYGLGLAIAKRIVLNHGGTIKASSNREEGTTTFKVEFK